MEIQAKKCIYSNAGDFLCILVKPYTGLRGSSANKKISPADISQDLWSKTVFCNVGGGFPDGFSRGNEKSPVPGYIDYSSTSPM